MFIDVCLLGITAGVFFTLEGEGMIFNWYYKLIDRLPDMMYKPLGGCLLCLSGQMGFWFYLVKYFNEYNLINHIFFISGVILAGAIVGKIFDYE